jgi:ribosomal protein S8
MIPIEEEQVERGQKKKKARGLWGIQNMAAISRPSLEIWASLVRFEALSTAWQTACLSNHGHVLAPRSCNRRALGEELLGMKES